MWIDPYSKLSRSIFQDYKVSKLFPNNRYLSCLKYEEGYPRTKEYRSDYKKLNDLYFFIFHERCGIYIEDIYTYFKVYEISLNKNITYDRVYFICG